MKKLYGKTRINGINSNNMNKNLLINLKYYKTKSILANLNEKKYGIQVVKEEVNGVNVIKEKCAAKYISNSEQTVENILEILLKNKVTPVATNDIITDLINSSEIL